MESKKPLEWLKDEMPHIPANGGQIALYEVTEALDQYSDYKNATLIEQNKKLRGCLEELRNNPKLWKRGGIGGQDQYAGCPSGYRLIDQTLKETEG